MCVFVCVCVSVCVCVKVWVMKQTVMVTYTLSKNMLVHVANDDARSFTAFALIL